MCNISLMSWCGFILRYDYWRGKMSHIKCTKYLVSFLEVKNRAFSTKKWNQASFIIINLSSRLKIARRHKYICLYVTKYSFTTFLILNAKDKFLNHWSYYNIYKHLQLWYILSFHDIVVTNLFITILKRLRLNW